MSNMSGMLGNHAERNVDQYDQDGVFVDTSLVTDAERPYETGVVPSAVTC